MRPAAGLDSTKSLAENISRQVKDFRFDCVFLIKLSSHA